MSKKTKAGAAGGAVAIFLAGVLALFGISGETIVEVGYELSKSETVYEMSLSLPEDAEADIVELYVSGNLVTKALMPNGTLKSIPFVFSDLENVELRVYKLGKVIGVGNFKDDRLYIAFKDGATKAEGVTADDED